MQRRPLTSEEAADAARLRALWETRLRGRISQEEFAHLCGWKTQSAFSQYMLGRVALNLSAALCIAKAFGVDVSEVSPRLAQQIETPHLTPDEIELLANYRNAEDREGKEVILSVSRIAPKKQPSAQNDEAPPGGQAKGMAGRRRQGS